MNNPYILPFVISLIVFFLILIWVVIKSHDAQKKVLEQSIAEIKEAKLKQEQDFRLLISVAEIYYSMHLIDLKNNLFYEMNAQNEVKEVLERNLKASDAMKEVMAATITDEHLQEALEFTDLYTLPERIKDSKFLYHDFHGKNVGWIRLSFIKTAADDLGYPTEVVVTTQRINDQKIKEEKLIRKTYTDELTGCYNRRAYENDLMSYSELPIEDNFVYVAMDINGLKIINDGLGHEAGDELIKSASHIMRRCVGNYGRVYRTGGDEFVALIYADDKKLENIINDFEQEQHDWHGELVDSLTISTGFSSKREFPEASVSELAGIADKRMYDAKTLYYKQKGIDRRGQQAAHKALCATYDKILKVNLTDDSFQIVNMHPDEQTPEKGFSENISSWLKNFAMTGQVHEDSLEEYLKKTDIDYLRDFFKSDNKSFLVLYKRMVEGTFKHAAMEIIPADDYSEDNQSVFLYVKSIDIS